MSRRKKEKYRATLLGLLSEKLRGYGLQPFFGPMGVSMVQQRGDRGALSCNVFNLRPSEVQSGSGYRVGLSGSWDDQDHFIALGELSPDSSGQSSGQWEFNPNNVGGCGRRLEEFDRVTIVVSGSPNLGELGKSIILEGKLGKSNNKSNLASQPALASQMPVTATNAKPQQILGLTYHQDGQIQYLVHGIQGKFRRQAQPHQGTTGYVYWHLAARAEENPGLGYWLVYLDPETGQVVFPYPVPAGC